MVETLCGDHITFSARLGEPVLNPADALQQLTDFQLRLQIHAVVQFAAHPIFTILAILAHHNDRSLERRQHRQE